MGSTTRRRRDAARRPAAPTPILLPLLSGLLLLILGSAVPGGADTGPAFPSLGPHPATATFTGTGSGTGRAFDARPALAATLAAFTAAAGLAPDLHAAPCGEDERPREREGGGHTQVRLRCATSDTRLLKTADHPAQRCPGARTATAAARPPGHDGRPPEPRARDTATTTALLQVFRC
ncbi:hypothetical protein Acsp03_07450 [Actinomadura sp. NBRC 104412]|uniref:hypothetical protein n=1 Tax=Actinomadura sp. NBRC 104412 TaxID=3032203 RepID=UPI0024A088A7|nr:hypothetical protein [Actinomadura sp. NBRC 104412]GLZ03278.1 hypothetical protein Acsp03_07450 [Actinomadura sp. NBRC 104412]